MPTLDPYDVVWMLGAERSCSSERRAVPRGNEVDGSGRTRPVLLYDGDCAFCRRCARLLERIEPDAEIVAWQSTNLAELGITEEQASDAVQWVPVDGMLRSGHEAIAGLLNAAGPLWKTIGHMLQLPGISWAAAKVYRLVADNRSRLPGSTPACEVTDEGRDRPAA